jgi:hypothetical protein
VASRAGVLVHNSMRSFKLPANSLNGTAPPCGTASTRH